MPTLAELIARHGIDVLDHLDRQLRVPVLDGLQLQGDVAVIPVPDGPVRTVAPGGSIPDEGVCVVRGELGGNSHQLIADGGGVRWSPASPHEPDALALGRLSVRPGSVAYLAHPEHAYAGIAPGTYLLRRQREFGEQIHLVND
jgi:hypothetical protein